MNIREAQRENRARFVGGFYGQLVSAILWLAGASLATWSTPRVAITTMVAGGFLIFPITELLIRVNGAKRSLSPENSLPQLGMQVAFVLPFSMPLLIPIGQHRLDLFFPALTILLGAHYFPFVFLYGMRMFAVLGGLLVAGGVAMLMYLPQPFPVAAWYTGGVLMVFAWVARAIARTEGNLLH